MLLFPFMLPTSNTTPLILLSVDEFSKMKDGVPPHIMDEHIKSYKQAVKEGKTTDPRFGLEKTLIAGAGRLSLSLSTLCFLWKTTIKQSNWSD